MKKVLVTGVSRGLGKLTKDFLIEAGWYVYGTRRDNHTSEANNYIDLPLDLESEASINNLIRYFDDKPLDAIIHNAGIAYKDPAHVLTSAECSQTFQVNFFGPCQLTTGLIPKLSESPLGRLIFISSIVSVDPWPHLGVYAASKAAMDRVAFEWSVLLDNIETSVIRPNPIPTDMQIQRGSEADPDVDDFKSELKWDTVEGTLNAINDALTTPHPNFEYYPGQNAKEAANCLQVENSANERKNEFRQLYR